MTSEQAWPLSALEKRAIEHLRGVLQRLGDDPLTDFARMESALQVLTLERGDVLEDGAAGRPSAYFVYEGLAKTRVQRSGDRPTLRFYAAGEFITTHAYAAAMLEGISTRSAGWDPTSRRTASLLRPRPADTVAVESSTMVRLDTRLLEELAAQNSGWANVTRALLSLTYLQVYGDLQRHVATRPEQRYRNLVADRPDLVRRLSQREIAGHLGITEVSMSRIVKRVNQRATTTHR